VDPDWRAVEEAEKRLDARGQERRRRMAARDRRRSWLPWVLCPLVLPALGAAAFLIVVNGNGGDLRDWTTAGVVGFVAACLAVPALLAAFTARHAPPAEMVAWALVTLLAEGAMIVGVGFLALGIGPD
jgi:hypothetical protein